MTTTAKPSAALPTPSPAADVSAGNHGADVSWRALSASLWVARRDGRHLGTVQRGRRWLAFDGESEPIGAYRTFLEAQEAVASPASRPEETTGPVRGGSVIAGVTVLVAALASAVVSAWATLLG